MARQQAQTDQLKIWKPETKGEKVEGLYTGEQTLDPQYKALYIVGDYLVPKKAKIEAAFKKIPVGSYVWIEFIDKIAIKGGKTVNLFKVEFDSDKIEEPVPF